MKRPFSDQSTGAAIIVILLVLVLITVLTVGFLSRSSTELRVAAVDRATQEALSLADLTVNVVQAQINSATQSENHIWATQPGAVRTYDDSGNPDRIFKLYSAQTLTESSAADLKADDQPPPEWKNTPALWTDLNEPVDYEGDERYPIFDPRAMTGADAVQGLSSSGGVTMPVRWLYVLADGRLVAPSTSGTTISIPGSDSSPIIGRVAFWTDDESCKVNVNTAGDGTYWDTPRGFSVQEGELANSQPFINEYQRYPGHPATTSLRAVFPSLTGQTILQNITPRYTWGGSSGGTVPTDSNNPILDLRNVSDRLYSSIDELVFSADRTAGVLARDTVEQRRFVLTTQSRAPETNLFNLPRVAIWPIHANAGSSYRTALDNEIARASTINGEPFYFQRQRAVSPTADFAIARNQTLYSYLDTLLGRPFPGFGGGSFSTKYPSGESQQILTSIVDYIRTTNLFDTVLDASSGGQTFTPGRESDPRLARVGHGQAAPLQHPGNGTMGFGRYFTISEASLHFICAGDHSNATSNDPSKNIALDQTTPLNNGEARLQVALLFELFSPSAGWTVIRPDMEVEVQGLENVLVNGVAVFPAEANGSTRINALQRWLVGARAWGVNPGVRYPLFLKYAPARGRIPADAVPTDSYASYAHLYPFISNFFTVNRPGGMSVTLADTLSINIYTTDASNARQLVQTIEIPRHDARPTAIPTLDPDNKWWTFSRTPSFTGGQPGRLAGIGEVKSNSTNPGTANARWFNASDVVVSWIPSHGDYRLVAGRKHITAATSPFAPHPSWTANNAFATTLYDNLPTYLLSNLYTGNKYRAGINYADDAMPDMPPGAPEVTNGDWDRGVANMLDGPYINKPDEGTIVRSATVTWIGDYPYFTELASSTQDIGTFFSPMRQVPSPGMFGSLPTGVVRDIPWQTLLFRPQPGHPGWSLPRDHLLMDLFWMPVVEPYAISEPFSTAGKVNMNFEILPFTKIERSTALHAVLMGEKIAAIPTTDGTRYSARIASPLNQNEYRLPLDLEQTLSQFTSRFSNDDLFRSASEICDLWIVPEGQSVSGMTTFWGNHLLTGENLRERIYTTLYPRLTTRSNAFTVHMKVQTLKKPASVPEGEWDEGRAQIASEYRGSALIERYLDPNDVRLPDYAADPDKEPRLSEFYRWRVLNRVRFAP